MFEVALHREAAAGRGILVALAVVAEAVVQLDLAAVGQVREPSGDLHADIRRASGAVVVAVAPVRIGLDRGDLVALGADLVGGRTGADRQHQRRPDVVGIGDHPLQRAGTAHRPADHRGHLGDAERRESGDVGLHLVAHGNQRKP